MIEKITDFKSLSGVLSPLLPLIFADGSFSHNDLDGAFLQKDENDALQAIFSLKNTCVTLILISDKEIEELRNFFSFCSVTEILSDKPLTQLCKIQKDLYLFESCEMFEEENKCFTINSKSTVSEYQDIYNLVFEDGTNFENWFPEFSKKINSFNSFATYFKVNKKVVSVAISPAVYKNNAVIAGVHTLEEHRNNGYARECVKALLNQLKINNISKVYLWCEKVNVDFYNKLNFKNIGKIYLGECN